MKEVSEVRGDIIYIIEKYVSDEVKKAGYLKEIQEIDPPPVRGIFSEMKADGIRIDNQKDCDIIHVIFDYFG